MPSQRWFSLRGASNARDLGGLRLRDGGQTRSGVLLRSDTPQELTAADVARLLGYGIRTVVDLRTPREAAHEGRGLLGEGEARARVAYANLPFVPDEVILPADEARRLVVAERQRSERVEHYLDYLRLAGPAVVAALEMLADADQRPALFHCAAGKDRTGVLAALVLELNGVQREAIVEDYAMTDEVLVQVAERLRRLESYSAYTSTLTLDEMRSEPETMRQLLSRIDELWGGAWQWARQAGLSEAAATRLSRVLH